jgi:hypothetical protein
VHGLSKGGDIGVGWIEVIADPMQPFGALLMVRIGDCIEELAVSPRPADILRRASSNSFDQARMGGPRLRVGNALDTDRVALAPI